MSQSEKELCVACGGTGKCSRCNGKGSTVRAEVTPIASMAGQVRGRTSKARTCTKCYGSGICQACKGSKKSS